MVEFGETGISGKKRHNGALKATGSDETTEQEWASNGYLWGTHAVIIGWVWAKRAVNIGR